MPHVENSGDVSKNKFGATSDGNRRYAPQPTTMRKFQQARMGRNSWQYINGPIRL